MARLFFFRVQVLLRTTSEKISVIHPIGKSVTSFLVGASEVMHSLGQ
jgi:hypothetical protein